MITSIAKRASLTASSVMVLTVIMLLAASPPASAQKGPSKEPSMSELGFVRITGYIEDISGNSIWIKGNEYDIRHAPVKDVRGRPKPGSLLTVGAKVAIYVKNKHVREVLFLHGRMVE